MHTLEKQLVVACLREIPKLLTHMFDGSAIGTEEIFVWSTDIIVIRLYVCQRTHNTREMIVGHSLEKIYVSVAISHSFLESRVGPLILRIVTLHMVFLQLYAHQVSIHLECC